MPASQRLLQSRFRPKLQLTQFQIVKGSVPQLLPRVPIASLVNGVEIETLISRGQPGFAHGLPMGTVGAKILLRPLWPIFRT